jgi:hypothetical protein
MGWGFLALVLGSALVCGADQPAPPSSPGGKSPDVQFGAYRLSGPYTHANLTIFLIHGPDQLKDKVFLTLQEALDQKKAVVHETKNVSELAIENLSPTEEIFIQAGDIVKGGQQDRILAVDLIVPAKSGKTTVKMPIASFCCESGRWSQRGEEAPRSFDKSDAQAANKDLKLAVRKSKVQRQVWDHVAKAQMKLGDNLGKSVKAQASETSYQLSLEDKKLQETVAEYVKQMTKLPDDKADVVGYVYAVNGKINSGDIYMSSALFKKVWPVLVKGSAVEAITEMQKDKKFEPVSAEMVKAFLVEVEKGKTTQQDLTARVKMVQQETKKGISFETRDRDNKDVMIRRSYVAY